MFHSSIFKHIFMHKNIFKVLYFFQYYYLLLHMCKILERIGLVAYKLDLPVELNGVHDTFHVSNLKKSPTQETVVIPADEVHINDTLHFTEEPVEVTNWKVNKMRRSSVKLVKVRWNARHGPEFTWEREDRMKAKYPYLFPNTPAASSRTKISG
ncbi:hypothetical protein HanRHA438_Chr16g0754711 [Helianthus annuus]|nr:hypothetical protein HanRHA438_Chr16g0754711 [Helianthus annuus]